MAKYAKDKKCKIDGCTKLVGAKGAHGMCANHYSQWRDRRHDYKKCSVDGCPRPIKGRGLCHAHLQQIYDYGKIVKTKITPKGKNKAHPLYSMYRGMVSRCKFPTASGYEYYGGRGIKVCERWLGPDGFKHFLEDMGDRPGGKYASGMPKYSLDRIDVNGDYCPENCRWADAKIQANNKNSDLVSGAIGVECAQKSLMW